MVVAAATEARKLEASVPTRLESEALSEDANAEEEDRARVPAADLVKRVLAEVDIIKTVVSKSGNLKGTFVRDLKSAASSIKAMVRDLSRRMASNESRLLRAENVRLKRELAMFRQEMTGLRSEMEALRCVGVGTAPPPSISVTSR